MFLKKLWNHNRLFAAAFVLFLLLYVFINFKRGATIAPVYELGMFAASFTIPDSQTIVRIVVDNKDTVSFSSLNYVQRDMLWYFGEKYSFASENNLLRMNTFKRIFSKAGAGGLITERNYVCPVTNKEFANWYMYLLERYTGRKYKTIHCFLQNGHFNGSRFVVSGSINPVFSNE